MTGEFRENAGGLIYSKDSFPGDIMMDFYAEMIPPCNNDLNFVFKTEGYDYVKNDAGKGYIASLNGWWDAKTGIEKYPECRPAAQTSLFRAEPGRRYHIQTGCVDGHCFIFADSRLLIEMTDDKPETFAKFGRFGFGTYCNKNRYSELTVYAIKWRVHEQQYSPEGIF